MTTGIHVKTGFFPLAFFLFFCTPVIEINGEKIKKPWGRSFFSLPPGEHTVRIYFYYFMYPECGANQITFSLTENQQKQIVFNMPPWMLAKGALSVQDHDAKIG